VLVFGGADVVPDHLVQAFDPATGTTTVIGHMPGPRADLVGAAVGNEVVLLAGFNGSAFVGNVWTTSDGTSFSVAGQIAAVERYPAIAAVGTKIYLFGGLSPLASTTGPSARRSRASTSPPARRAWSVSCPCRWPTPGPRCSMGRCWCSVSPPTS
jgi:hypothetical protein